MKQVNYTVPGDDKEFFRCIQFVMEQECRKRKDGTLDDGYVNDPHDPGGETKYGISSKAYPKLDIKNLSLDDALCLYHRDYWYVSKFLTFPLNICAFDCAVNQGTKRAKEFLAVSKNDWVLFTFQREQHYLSLIQGKFKDNPNKEKYRKAWFSRLNNLKKFIAVASPKSPSS